MSAAASFWPMASPHTAHSALAKLEQNWAGEVMVITQNIDDLHERAGSVSVLHMHGEILKARRLACGAVSSWRDDLERADLFLAVGTSGQVYPAAGFVRAVRDIGRARTIELNLEPSAEHGQFDQQRIGAATDVVPALVSELLRADG